MFFKEFLAVLLVTTSVTLALDNQKRVLVLLDHFGIRETHSTYFRTLRDDGFQLTFKTADDSSLALSKYGDYLYDHLILFSPSVVEFGGNISSKAIVEFIDAGGNVLVAANSDIGEPIKEIAGECGLEFSDEGTYVIDRFNYDENDDGRNNLLAVNKENLIKNKIITGDVQSPLLYRGLSMSADPDNPLLLNILTASSTSFTYRLDEKITEYPHTVGKSTLLIAALQARNNARVTFVGSLDFFSNDFFESSVKAVNEGAKKFDKSGNQDLCVSLTKWTFKERGVLRVVKVEHHKVGEKQAPQAYTIKENIVYSILIEEYSNGKWSPFAANDVQLEFIRLDPFVRTTLKPTNGIFKAEFVLPDVYGVFKFSVDYNRVGYTHLESVTQVKSIFKQNSHRRNLK